MGKYHKLESMLEEELDKITAQGKLGTSALEVEPAHLMATLDELVGCVQILDARLYQSFIQKLKGEEE